MSELSIRIPISELSIPKHGKTKARSRNSNKTAVENKWERNVISVVLACSTSSTLEIAFAMQLFRATRKGSVRIT